MQLNGEHTKMYTIEYIVENSGVWLEETERDKANCVVKFLELEEEVEFTAVRDDIYDYAEQILDALIAGEAGAVKSFAEYSAELAAEEEEQEAKVRKEYISMIETLDPEINLSSANTPGDSFVSTAELSKLFEALEEIHKKNLKQEYINTFK